MYSVIASIKSTAPAMSPQSSAVARPKFPTADFVSLIAMSVVCGLATGLVAAGVVMLLAQA
ncbi:MAG: hypothetical protein HY255_10220 [Betaproteobacteria bacterium]|nr:hypothetical protein [Betaproteobacteria bacterium]